MTVSMCSWRSQCCGSGAVCIPTLAKSCTSQFCGARLLIRDATARPRLRPFRNSFRFNFYLSYVSIEGYIGCCVFSLSGYRYLGNHGTDRREILHDGTCRSRTDLLPFWGWYPRDLQIRNFGLRLWRFDGEYLENGKSQHYMSIRA